MPSLFEGNTLALFHQTPTGQFACPSSSLACQFPSLHNLHQCPLIDVASASAPAAGIDKYASITLSTINRKQLRAILGKRQFVRFILPFLAEKSIPNLLVSPYDIVGNVKRNEVCCNVRLQPS